MRPVLVRWLPSATPRSGSQRNPGSIASLNHRLVNLVLQWMSLNVAIQSHSKTTRHLRNSISAYAKKSQPEAGMFIAAFSNSTLASSPFIRRGFAQIGKVIKRASNFTQETSTHCSFATRLKQSGTTTDHSLQLPGANWSA